MSKLNNISVDGTVYNINDFHVIKNNSYNNPFIITEHEPGIYIVDSSEADYLPGKLYAKYIDSEDYNVRTEYYDGFLCLTDTSIDDPYTYKNIGYIFDASAGLAHPCVTQPAPWGFSLTAASSGIGNSAVKTIGNQTVSGKKTFSTLPESSVVPTTNNQLVNKKYVDELGVKVGTSVDNNYRVNVLHSKNLLNYTIPLTTNFGVTTSMSDGKLILDGTTTGAGDIYDNTTNTILLKAGTYTISATKISGGFQRADTAINIRKISDGGLIFALVASDNYTKVTTLTLSEDTLVRVQIYTNTSGMEFSNLVINLQIERGSTATDFEIPVTPSINVDGETIYTKGQDEVYSTVEQRIGTWIDGKPLYRKVFMFTDLPTNTNNDLTIDGYSTMNIQKMDGIVIGGDSNFKVNINSFFLDDIVKARTATRAIQNSISSYCGEYLTGNFKYSINLILEYTKTTDA